MNYYDNDAALDHALFALPLEEPPGDLRARILSATIYQRPRTQGRMAFRVLHEFLAEGECPSYQVTLAPHLVMRGNLDFFLARQSSESIPERRSRSQSASPEAGERFAGPPI